MKLKIVLLTIIALAITSCKGQPSKNIQTIDAVAFSKAIQATPNPQVIDVRTPEEFTSGHLDQAQNINWFSSDFVTNSAKYDKSKPVFVYCKSGGRSHKAAEKLTELGFTKVIEMEGGIMKWDAAGLSTPSEKIIGICSQEYSELLNTNKKVLIDFNAKWCAPCKKMAPYIEQMKKEMADNITIISLDADENKTMVNELKVSELPTLLLYQNKKIIWKHTGYISEEELKNQLK